MAINLYDSVDDALDVLEDEDASADELREALEDLVRHAAVSHGSSELCDRVDEVVGVPGGDDEDDDA